MNNMISKTGFSLIEAIVTIAVIAVLATLVLGLSKRVETQAKERLTSSTIEVLMTAVGMYYDLTGEYPDKVNDPATSDPLDINNLFKQLNRVPDSRRIAGAIDESQISPAQEYLDAWEKPLDYSYMSGDDFPVIFSAGADGDESTGADNITSR